jgi:hypothetical protein
VAEEPEEVLPQHRVAASGRVEKGAAEASVDEQHRQGGGEDREGEEDHQRSYEDVPGEDRHPEHPHAGRPHRVDRGDEVHRAEDARDANEREPDDPQVEADAGLPCRVAQRDVAGPSGRGRSAPDEEAAQHHERTEQEHPEREGVHARERHVLGADLERDDVVREADGHRRPEQQKHDRAVHREQLVVALLGGELEAGRSELGPDLGREQAADEEHHERRRDVQDADALVIGRREPPGESADFRMGKGDRAARGLGERRVAHRAADGAADDGDAGDAGEAFA